MRVAVTGGAATGKSTVMCYLRDMGAAVVSADDVARQVTAPGSALLAPLARLAGSDVLESDGSLCRGRLAERMFADADLRRAVEDLLHPPIIEAMERAAAACAAKIVCFEIPLLIETGLQARYDVVVLCRCGVGEQIRRLTRRLEGDMRMARRIVASQVIDSVRRPYADFVVMTNREPHLVKNRVHSIFANLLRRSRVFG